MSDSVGRKRLLERLHEGSDQQWSIIRELKRTEEPDRRRIPTVAYSIGSIGWLIYLKASVTNDEDVGVAQYRSVHPTFPHETMADRSSPICSFGDGLPKSALGAGGRAFKSPCPDQ
jgi:hypothetical protein